MSGAGRRWPAWAWIGLAVFAALWLHGALLGPTDDEAYYWVLGQRPSLGYAYHPPAIGWTIALFQGALGWLFGKGSVALLRLPAALLSGAIVALALRWMERAGAPRERLPGAAGVLLSLAGVFAASWMIVPDLPLMLGWTLLFTGAWDACFAERVPRRAYLALGIGAALALLSKYSAVLAAGSAGLAILGLARRDGGRRLKGCLAIGLGVAAALVPILLFNARTGWGSLHYQLQERHGDLAFSGIRYLRFWVVQLAIAGPLLVAYALAILPRRALSRARASDDRRALRFALLFVAPAALVFCVQPAFSDFKVHWALVVWFPAALALALEHARGAGGKLARAQRAYGLALGALVLALCHVPVLAPWVKDPRLDVTNDMHGWTRLPEWLAREAPPEDRELPVVGSRYQTASQAALALGDWSRVVLLPRDLKQLDEWRDLGVTDRPGPAWPKLVKPVLFVADNRYSAPPEFSGASCRKRARLETFRAGRLARWLDVWRCDPSN